MNRYQPYSDGHVADHYDLDLEDGPVVLFEDAQAAIEQARQEGLEKGQREAREEILKSPPKRRRLVVECLREIAEEAEEEAAPRLTSGYIEQALAGAERLEAEAGRLLELGLAREEARQEGAAEDRRRVVELVKEEARYAWGEGDAAWSAGMEQLAKIIDGGEVQQGKHLTPTPP